MCAHDDALGTVIHGHGNTPRKSIKTEQLGA